MFGWPCWYIIFLKYVGTCLGHPVFTSFFKYGGDMFEKWISKNKLKSEFIGKSIMQGWGILHGIPQIQWAKPKQNPNRSVCLNNLPTEEGQIRSKTPIVATNGPASFYLQVANLFVFELVSRGLGNSARDSSDSMG